ncbi:MAG: RimK/LysX family protein [Nanoarchaeota archaeon]|nr:RimK/LysX family protein [Nanoarchaeota archaeon]
MARKILGIIETIGIIRRDSDGKLKSVKVRAKVDTGASRSSISKVLVKKYNLGPVRKTTIIKSAMGREKREVIKITVKVKGKRIKAFFNVANRKHMKYNMLIGKNVLKLGKFLIDPLKQY